MWSRRQFIKAMGVLGGAIMTPFQWLGRAQASPPSDDSLPPGAELYEGFLLLPEGASVPKIVKAPRLQPPNMCGVGVKSAGYRPYAVTKFFSTPEILAHAVDFPMYALAALPEKLRHASAFVVSHETGEIYGASLGYDAFNPEIDGWVCNVSFWAQPDFPKPFPLWSSEPAEPEGLGLILEKVDFLPVPGIRVITKTGCAYHWITENVFYTMNTEFGPNDPETKLTVDALARIH